MLLAREHRVHSRGGHPADQAPREVFAVDDAEVAVENNDEFVYEGEADNDELDDDIVAESDEDDGEDADEDKDDDEDADERLEKDSDSFAYLLK